MDKEELKIIGTKLQQLRKQAGLSRRQFSEIYNFAEGTIKLWELGQVEMGVIKLSKYLEIFQDFGIYIDLNTLIKSANDFNDNYNLILQKFYQLSVFLENIGQDNTLFYVKSTGEIVYFNPQYKHILECSTLRSSNAGTWYIDNIFDEEHCQQILAQKTEKLIININKKLPNSILNLEIELSPSLDMHNNAIGVTGFLLSKAENYVV
jgi:transcriptional regulator with XRE-family HTH domain